MLPGPHPPAPPARGAEKKATPAWLIVLVVVGVGAVILLGTLASLAIHGGRRYLGVTEPGGARLLSFTSHGSGGAILQSPTLHHEDVHA